LKLQHNGRYRCRVQRSSRQSLWDESEPVTVIVHGVPLSGVSLSVQPPGGQVALGNPLVLSCAVAMGTGPLSFSWQQEGLGHTIGTGPCLEVLHIGDNDSGRCQCRVSDGDSMAESPILNVTVLAERDRWAE
ncbi:FCRL2 protein, partial [Rhabdornis inornatus]|nr:FCRL2 protein [Rhabdornis inornatus]